MTQLALDTFVLERSKEVKGDTLNKDIKNMHAFLKWVEKKRYVSSDLKVKRVKVSQKPVVALSPAQVKSLLAVASKYPTMRLWILLTVTTGLR